jgi:hypothetical protein
MNLAFAMASNNPEQLAEFMKTIKMAMIPDWSCRLYIAAQSPLTVSALADIPQVEGLELHVTFIPPVYNKELGVIDMLTARRAVLSMVELEKDNDYIFWCDDDMRFANGTRSYLRASSADRIYDSACYLDDNPNCGIVQHMTFFGGSQAALKIMPVKSGYFETGIGFLMRANDLPHIDPRFNFLGAGCDVIVYLTKIMNGYYVARNYNNPTRKRPTKQVVPGNPNRHYDLNFIQQYGMIAKIKEITGGSYQYGKAPPKEIRYLHRIGASLRGFPAFY